MLIRQINALWCDIDVDYINFVKPCLKYNKTIFIRKKFGGEKKTYDAYFMTGNRFLLGFTNRVFEFCLEKGEHPTIKYLMANSVSKRMQKKIEPNLPGIIFRDDQKLLLDKMTTEKIGVIKSPTGSGKTVLALGYLSQYPNARAIFLCHNTSIIKQASKEAKKWGFDYGICSKTLEEEDDTHPLTFASIQTFWKYPSKKIDQYDIIIIDEAHHIASLSGMYGKTIVKMKKAVSRIGFTATLPEKKEQKFVLEGLMGPIIGEVTIQEGIKKGFLAKPKITLISVPVRAYENARTYKKNYELGIIKNRVRNHLIVQEAKKRIEDNKTVLIMVKEIEHGDNIKAIFDLFKIPNKFVQGKTNTTVREVLRTEFVKKRIKCVICTNVWREGIDITTLDVVINACGGKSEVQTLQTIGRGLRKTDKKSTVEIIDFLDVNYYLSAHGIRRMAIYVEAGWL